MDTAVVALYIGILISPGNWAILPSHKQTSGWSDCETRAQAINMSAFSLILAFCKPEPGDVPDLQPNSGDERDAPISPDDDVVEDPSGGRI